jgi:hypothetical protein
MSTITISQLPNSGALTGTEVLPIVQSNATVKTTAQDIANLAGGIIAVGAGTCSTVRVDNNNTASGACSTVSGGKCNTASCDYSIVGGGFSNTASGFNSTIAGGINNITSGSSSTIGGGRGNTASGAYSTVGGGGSGYYGHTASGDRSTVSGGAGNIASGNYSTVSGGNYNAANSTHSGILGGTQNTIPSGCNYAMIVGSCITADRCNTTFVNNLSIVNIPTSSAGLPSGAVWSDLGTLKIV